jgi:putative membrane protein
MARPDHRSDSGVVAAATGRTAATSSAPAAGPAPAPRAEPDAVTGSETEPDARYTFANERTFLAWTRTALAFIVAGLGIVQLLPPFPGVPWGRHLLGIPLIVIGAVIALVGYRQWASNQRAMRRREPVRRSALPQLLVWSIVGMAAVAAVVVALSAVLRH